MGAGAGSRDHPERVASQGDREPSARPGHPRSTRGLTRWAAVRAEPGGAYRSGASFGATHSAQMMNPYSAISVSDQTG
ncbi:hypothetical protein GCM10022207_40830 [Streptomyces lannensis]|uniref:Uncharacterized protein n=1 Tax=Streptomyces lannensis TaxID=766498 RepID=A0ABP7KCL0_9ACTN